MISYLAALPAAVTNATSNALNRKAARGAPGRDQFRLRLISDLLHRKAPPVAALQADGPGMGGPPAGQRERHDGPVKAGHR